MMPQPRIPQGRFAPLAAAAALAAALGGFSAAQETRKAEPAGAGTPKDQPAAAKAAGAGAAPTLPRPKWNVGDSWIIETVSDRIQERSKVEKGQAIRWEFKVVGMDRLAGSDCYKIEITCLAEKAQVKPKSTIWVDARTMTLRQIQTQLAFAGRLRSVTESYEAATEGATPIMTPFNALPIDLPAFLPPGSKALESFTYTSQPRPAGSKDPGTLRFVYAVQQDVAPAGAKALELVPNRFAKDLGTRPVVQVRIKGPDRTVTQLWQQDQPWPLYSDNGRTQARLVSVGAARP